MAKKCGSFTENAENIRTNGRTDQVCQIKTLAIDGISCGKSWDKPCYIMGNRERNSVCIYRYVRCSPTFAK